MTPTASIALDEDFDRTGEILDTNTARETLASSTAADPAGEADDASSADQSTAALTEVPGTAPDHQDLRDIADAPRSYPPEPQQKAAEHASSGSVAGAPAGTQAPPVDTHSEPEGASIGAKPSMASEPATEEGTGPQPSSVVPGRQPGCLNPDTCAGTWRKRCATCERAFMAVAAGGEAIVHQGSVVSGIPAWAVRGAKVVCVDAGPASANVFGSGWGETEAIFEGRIYTIKAVRRCHRYGSIVVDLYEVARDASSIRQHGPDVGYNLCRFRPLVTRSQEQDIATHFRDLLRQPEPVA